jgi:hypothetical protein
MSSHCVVGFTITRRFVCVVCDWRDFTFLVKCSPLLYTDFQFLMLCLTNKQFPMGGFVVMIVW